MNKNKTYKLQLPKDVNVDNANLRIHDGQIVVDVEFKEEFKPKDGDFLRRGIRGAIIIYKETAENGAVISYAGAYRCNITTETKQGWGFTRDFRFATADEKSEFLSTLEKECGKRWNAYKRQLEDIRWKPKDGEIFYNVSVHGEVHEHFMCQKSAHLVDANNCFKTKELARCCANKFRELLKQSRAE